MMKLVFATNNSNKIKEIKHLLNNLPGVIGTYELLSLEDIGCLEDIPETANTIEGNAIKKAQYIYEKYGYNCFADDTGLEIDALNGEPGVYSARYAGEQKNPENNMNKVLDKLKDVENRSARFKTVIVLIIDGNLTCFEGIVEGEITKEKSGLEGFGYDPIFKPKGYNLTFSEMNLEVKNSISHRGKAIIKLINYLKK